MIKVETTHSRRKLVAFKIYFDRARMYLGYINFFMLNLVLINSFDNPAAKEMIQEYKILVIPLLFALYTVILVFIGYLDTKLGFRQEELRNNAAINPVIQDLISTVNEIRDEVKSKQ